MTSLKTDLLELKNLGRTTVNLLNAIGIRSCAELQCSGTVDAYVKLKQRGFRVSKVLLYALEAAMEDIHWNDLPEKRKKSLLDEAEKKLKNNL